MKGRLAENCMLGLLRSDYENWDFLITQRTHVINFHYFIRLHRSPLCFRNYLLLVAFPAACLR